MSINRDLHRIISEHSHADLQVLIQYLGEACEIRQPIYPKEANPSSVFANPKRFADEIEYGDGLEATALLIPLGGEPPLATDQLEPMNAASLSTEPMRCLVMGITPEERAVITVIRNAKEKHYYVLQRSLLTQEAPRIVQCWLIPMDVEGVLEQTELEETIDETTDETTVELTNEGDPV